MSLLENLPHRCNIYRRIRTTDAIGGNVDSFELLHQNAECWVQQASASEINTYQKRHINVTQKVYFTTDYNLNEVHQIRIVNLGNGVIANPDRLDVVSYHLPDVSGGLQLLFRAMANNQTGGP